MLWKSHSRSQHEIIRSFWRTRSHPTGSGCSDRNVPWRFITTQAHLNPNGLPIANRLRDRLSYLGVCANLSSFGGRARHAGGSIVFRETLPFLPSHRPTSLVEMVAYLATLRAVKSGFLSGAHPVQLQMARTCKILSGYIPIASIHVLDNVAHQQLQADEESRWQPH